MTEEERISESLFDFMERLIFDVILMASENKQLLEVTKIYLRMLDMNLMQTFKIVEKRILVDKSKLEKD